jgi:hypothetical protein
MTLLQDSTFRSQGDAVRTKNCLGKILILFCHNDQRGFVKVMSGGKLVLISLLI